MLNSRKSPQRLDGRAGVLIASVPTMRVIGNHTVLTQIGACESGERKTGNDLVNMRGNGKERLIRLIQKQLGKEPPRHGVKSKKRFTPPTEGIYAAVAAKQLPNFSPLTTLPTMEPSIVARLVRAAVNGSFIGLGKTITPKAFRFFVGIANGVRDSQVFVLTREPLTTSLTRRRAKRLEAGGIRKGDDIVCSVWQHTAADPMAGQEVARLSEHKGSLRIT